MNFSFQYLSWKMLTLINSLDYLITFSIFLLYFFVFVLRESIFKVFLFCHFFMSIPGQMYLCNSALLGKSSIDLTEWILKHFHWTNIIDFLLRLSSYFIFNFTFTFTFNFIFKYIFSYWFNTFYLSLNEIMLFFLKGN